MKLGRQPESVPECRRSPRHGGSHPGPEIAPEASDLEGSEAARGCSRGPFERPAEGRHLTRRKITRTGAAESLELHGVASVTTGAAVVFPNFSKATFGKQDLNARSVPWPCENHLQKMEVENTAHILIENCSKVGNRAQFVTFYQAYVGKCFTRALNLVVFTHAVPEAVINV